MHSKQLNSDLTPDVTGIEKQRFAQDLTNHSIKVPYDCFFQCFAKTGNTSGTPEVKIILNDVLIYEGCSQTGQYKYAWSPMFRVKKDDNISLTLKTNVMEHGTNGEKTYQFFPFR